MDMTSTQNTIRYYDHSKNQTNAAVAHAVARAAREAKIDGDAYWVEFIARNGEINFWEGSAYDALALGKQLASNNIAVTITKPNGKVMTPQEIKAARF